MNFLIDEGEKEPEVFAKLDVLFKQHPELVIDIYSRLESRELAEDYTYIVIYGHTNSVCLCQSNIIIDGDRDCNMQGAKPCTRLDIRTYISDSMNVAFLTSDFISYCERRNIT